MDHLSEGKAGVCAIAIMAKAPRAGQSKTRLCPPLSPDQAAALSAAFLRDMTGKIATAAEAAPITGFVAHARSGTEHLFEGMLAPGTGFILADGETGIDGLVPPGVIGLGRCLFQAAQLMLAKGFGAVCLLNSDSPTLPSAVLARAASALLAPGERVVLGPSEDGGYYLIGMKSAHARLIANIAWRTDTVAGATRVRAMGLGLEIVELPVWYDVDEHATLDRLIAEIGEHRSPRYHEAPATEAALRQMGLLAVNRARAAG